MQLQAKITDCHNFIVFFVFLVCCWGLFNKSEKNGFFRQKVHSRQNYLIFNYIEGFKDLLFIVMENIYRWFIGLYCK